MICGAMRPISSMQQRGPFRRLRVAVVWVAVLLFALAPAVSALCALEVHGAANSGPGTVQAPTAPEDGTGGGDDPCCAAVSAPVIESSKPFGASLAASMQPVGPFVAAARQAAARVFSAVHPLAHLPTPPPEPVSRRFPRLLL